MGEIKGDIRVVCNTCGHDANASKTPKPQRPKTCRECVFCGEPTQNCGLDDWAPCYINPGFPGDTFASRPACHLGELRDEPWEEEDK